MYNSPIDIIYGQMQTQMEGDILKAVQQVDIHVDKEELIRVLQYDREQYDRGFADGYQKARDELVHGRWIEHEWAEEENGLLVSNFECSACHNWERKESDYCPNCGAKMDGDGDG